MKKHPLSFASLAAVSFLALTLSSCDTVDDRPLPTTTTTTTEETTVSRTPLTPVVPVSSTTETRTTRSY